MHAGLLIDKRYRLDSLLGRGGMGEVWRAHDPRMERTVAVKFVSAVVHAEARAHAKVKHPNIVDVYDTGEAIVDGRRLGYLIMEYIPGHTLAEALQTHGKASEPDTRHVARQVLAALAHIHGVGMVHRDIKPHNIMLTKDGRTVVMDFGIARPAATDTTVTAIGTPGYAAPEQIGGRSIDGRTDLYALGKVLSECLLGARWNADDLAHLPSPLRDLLDSMTHPDPEQRPKDAAECLRRLTERSTAPPPSTERLPRHLDWEPWTLLARLFAGLALAAVAAGSGWLGVGITHWHRRTVRRRRTPGRRRQRGPRARTGSRASG